MCAGETLIRIALPLVDSHSSLLGKAANALSFPITFPQRKEDGKRQNKYRKGKDSWRRQEKR